MFIEFFIDRSRFNVAKMAPAWRVHDISSRRRAQRIGGCGVEANHPGDFWRRAAKEAAEDIPEKPADHKPDTRDHKICQDTGERQTYRPSQRPTDRITQSRGNCADGRAEHAADACPNPATPRAEDERAEPEADAARGNDAGERSEEHTSELQSPLNLVCRLLLEKK